MSQAFSKSIRPLPWFWGLLSFSLLIDQLTKYWALVNLRPIQTQVLIEGYWNWTYVENTGVAFGFLQGHNNLLALFVFLMIIFSYWIARDFNWKNKEINFLGSFILAGAIGNGIDRFRHGFVIDFVDWHFRGWHWPAFNVADSLICMSVAWILYRQLFPPKNSSYLRIAENQSPPS